MNVRLQYDLEFLAGIYYDDQLQINNYEVSINLLTKTTDSASTNVAMERLKAFVHGVLAEASIIPTGVKPSLPSGRPDDCTSLLSPGLYQRASSRRLMSWSTAGARDGQ